MTSLNCDYNYKHKVDLTATLRQYGLEKKFNDLTNKDVEFLIENGSRSFSKKAKPIAEKSNVKENTNGKNG